MTNEPNTRVPSSTVGVEALATLEFPIPFKLWADRIENTTVLIRVQEADCYHSAMDMARIDCFYAFEAKRLVALLRALAQSPTLASEKEGGKASESDK